MIKLFRKIRQKLLSENKFSKYFIYAFGEIILVVIGILIALQINNWNEQRKLEQQESTYYCKIKEDISSDLFNIQRSKKSLDERQKTTKRLLTNLLKIQDNKSIIMKDYLASLRSYIYVPNKSAITDVTSSGKLENLKNEDLKNAILNYYSEQEYALNVIGSNQNNLNEKIFDYEDYSGFGIQELPLYQTIYGDELQSLFTSIDWHKDPNNMLFIHLKNHMNMNMILCQREKQLITDIERKAMELRDSLQSYCIPND